MQESYSVHVRGQQRSLRPGRAIPVTSKLVIHRLPCKVPGVIGSALALVGPVPVFRQSLTCSFYCIVEASTYTCLSSLLFVGCLTSQQHASVSQGRICTDNFTCCHTEIEAADQTFHLTQSQYTDTGPTSPSADPITPGAWQGSHWSANF